jgi:ABC-type molybdenum transport system ATPase subunit/photorepair protein PhrA
MQKFFPLVHFNNVSVLRGEKNALESLSFKIDVGESGVEKGIYNFIG